MIHLVGVHGFHFIPFPILLILLLLAAFLIARSYGYLGGSTIRTEEPEKHNFEALDIISRRFAKGEIDEEEFQKRTQVLHQSL